VTETQIILLEPVRADGGRLRQLQVVPVVLGAGERLLDGLGGFTFEPMGVIASPTVTHLLYRVPR
jgi:hypothetical protein